MLFSIQHVRLKVYDKMERLFVNSLPTFGSGILLCCLTEKTLTISTQRLNVFFVPIVENMTSGWLRIFHWFLTDCQRLKTEWILIRRSVYEEHRRNCH